MEDYRRPLPCFTLLRPPQSALTHTGPIRAPGNICLQRPRQQMQTPQSPWPQDHSLRLGPGPTWWFATIWTTFGGAQEQNASHLSKRDVRREVYNAARLDFKAFRGRAPTTDPLYSSEPPVAGPGDHGKYQEVERKHWTCGFVGNRCQALGGIWFFLST